MLACTWFPGSHTADATAEQFDKTTAMFDLTNMISYIVTDSAANMLKAFSLPGFEDVAVPDAISDDSSDGAQGVEMSGPSYMRLLKPNYILPHLKWTSVHLSMNNIKHYLITEGHIQYHFEKN